MLEVINRAGASIAKQDFELLLEYFTGSTDPRGMVSYETFMHMIRGPQTSRRLKQCRDVFAQLDRDGDGCLSPNEIFHGLGSDTRLSRLEGHDLVVAKRKIAEEWLDVLTEGNAVGMVSGLDFERYYHNIGSTVDTDVIMFNILRSSWIGPDGEAVLSVAAARPEYVGELTAASQHNKIVRGDKTPQSARHGKARFASPDYAHVEAPYKTHESAKSLRASSPDTHADVWDDDVWAGKRPEHLTPVGRKREQESRPASAHRGDSGTQSTGGFPWEAPEVQPKVPTPTRSGPVDMSGGGRLHGFESASLDERCVAHPA